MPNICDVLVKFRPKLGRKIRDRPNYVGKHSTGETWHLEPVSDWLELLVLLLLWLLLKHLGLQLGISKKSMLLSKQQIQIQNAKVANQYSHCSIAFRFHTCQQVKRNLPTTLRNFYVTEILKPKLRVLHIAFLFPKQNFPNGKN